MTKELPGTDLSEPFCTPINYGQGGFFCSGISLLHLEIGRRCKRNAPRQCS